MKHMRSFISGALCMLLLLSLVATAYAAAGRTIDVAGGIRLFLHGKELDMTDANGGPAEAFIHDGMTYAPVRALSEALGKSVAWSSKSRSVYIDEPLSAGERLGISRIVFRHWSFGRVLHRYTVDFQSCQLTSEDFSPGEKDAPEPYNFSSHVPSERQPAFFEAAEAYGLLHWNDPDWEWYGPGTVTMISDGVSYDISVIMDDGTEWTRRGHESYPVNWNEIREALRALTDEDILYFPAPALTPAESMGITKITVSGSAAAGGSYVLDLTDNSLTHRYTDSGTGQSVSETAYPGRGALLAFVEAVREQEVLRWNDADWPWSKPAGGQDECRIRIDYYSDAPLNEGSDRTAFGYYYCEYGLAVGGESGYPEN